MYSQDVIRPVRLESKDGISRFRIAQVGNGCFQSPFNNSPRSSFAAGGRQFPEYQSEEHSREFQLMLPAVHWDYRLALVPWLCCACLGKRSKDSRRASSPVPMWLLTSPFDTRLVLCVSIAFVALAALAFCLERASGQASVGVLSVPDVGQD